MVGGSVDRKHRIVQFCRETCSLRLLTWVVALSSAAWSSYVYYDRSFRCPEGTVCIEGDSFGAGPPVTPYTEFTEVTNSHAVYRVSALLKTEQSPYQLVQAYQSHFFGKILVIDGALMITERDESNYHETLVHTTLNYLPDARRVLVIGGGDGGTVTQLLKHPNLREIVWVEIDEVVLRFARQFFPHLAKAQSDPRVTLRVQNAARFVQEAQYPAAPCTPTRTNTAAPGFRPNVVHEAWAEGQTNADGWTPLIAASWLGHAGVVKLLTSACGGMRLDERARSGVGGTPVRHPLPMRLTA